MAGGEQLAQRTCAIFCPNYSRDQPSPGFFLPVGVSGPGRGGVGGKRVEGARGIFCFLAKGNFSLPWEGTCIDCSNLSWSCILPSLLGHNFLFERSCLSKRGSAPSHQLLLRVELKAADPVAAEESCVSWDLCGVSERAYGAVSTLHTSLSPQPQPPHSLPYSSS